MLIIEIDSNEYYYKNKFSDLTIREYLEIAKVMSQKQNKLLKEGERLLDDNECDYSFYIEKQLKIIKLKSNIPIELITEALYYKLISYDETDEVIKEEFIFNRNGSKGILNCNAPTLDTMPFLQFVDFMSMLNSDNQIASFSILTASIDTSDPNQIKPIENFVYDSSNAIHNLNYIGNLNASKYIKDFYYYLYEFYRNVLKNNFYYILDSNPSPSKFVSKSSVASINYYKHYSWYALLLELSESGLFGNYYDVIKMNTKLALTALHIRLGKQFAESEDYKLNNK